MLHLVGITLYQKEYAFANFFQPVTPLATWT